MSTTYTMQVVQFIYPKGVDPLPVILADPGVQTYLSYGVGVNPAGIFETEHYISFPLGNQVTNDSRLVSIMCNSTNAANIVADQGNLQTRMNAAFPGLTVSTWGYAVELE